MAYVRRLPSGKWQATVRHPSGRRMTRADPLRRVVAEWAREQEALIARGVWRDPRAGRITVEDWSKKWTASRVVEPGTLRMYESRLRLHILPTWKAWPLDSVTRMDVEAWVRRLGEDGVGARTVQQSLMILGAMLGAAVQSGLIGDNSARGVAGPRTSAGRLRFFTRDEFRAITGKLKEPDRTLVDFACHVGLRWGELTGLDGEHVDFLRKRVTVSRVLTRDGLREYPKSKRAHRVVPIPAHLIEPMSALLVGRPRDALVFTSPTGKQLDTHGWRRRVWIPALEDAKVPYAPPHTMRHTAASWLVMAGVDLYRVQGLMGHESYATTQRYAHLAPDAEDRILDAWDALDEPRDAPGTHGGSGSS